MSAFSEIASTGKKPDHIVTLGPDAFATSWPHKPVKAVPVGLLFLSEGDCLTIRAEASKRATELHPNGPSVDPDWIDARNDELLAWALSRSLCKPTDATEAFFSDHGQDEDIITEALLPQTIRHLWDELERVTIASSPVRIEATDDEIDQLSDLLRSGAIGNLVRTQQIRLRKLCSFMLDELSPFMEFDDELEGDL
jgi:hypothetical protein